MRILIINDHGSPIGGAEIMTYNLSRTLAERGHEVHIFCSKGRAIPGSRFGDSYCFGAPGESRIRMFSQVVNPSAFWTLKKVLRSFRPDVVHIRMFLFQISPIILPLLRDIPTIYHAVWYKPICPTGKKLLPDGSICASQPGKVCYKNKCLSPQAFVVSMAQLYLWEKWRSAVNLIIANSQYVGRQLQEAGLGNIEIVWNGIPVQSERKKIAAYPLVVYAGRLNVEKGVDVLLKAFAKVVQQIPEARLLIAGDGGEKGKLILLHQHLNLTSNVEFLGHIDRVTMEECFEEAWVQVIPSTWPEPFGIVAAEAMMRGTAVIATNKGGLGEIVQDEQTGLLFPPSDSDALAKQLIRLLTNEELMECLGRQGRAFAMEHFTTEVFTDRIEQIYKELLLNQGSKILSKNE